ncbi:LytTR family transcriptional regulator [Anaerococcus sp. AGMB00486]|uniref:LytTR family transcriptional regulator n=2 Tax=Anaerococcus TaxID=165779 RepID=A0ABX2NAA2_9FIRM|nr:MULTISPECIES: LytTR family DNA-binding domain-containing protein [Anaerococcus]MSS77748.1 LytTR family transcriptional regulator [Anaerococcus porci]NVF11603.1 LytTR family transcriptional regulator [Anaerococcus faecalis]
MKVEIIIDKSLDDTLVKIYTPSYSKDIESIQKSLENLNKNVLVGFKDGEVYILDYKDIVRFTTNDKKIYIETLDNRFMTRLRLYEIAERVDNKYFLKISRYEIINIEYVKRLDLSFKGTIAIEFKNGEVSYVSRRYLKEFKKMLGF